jgi:hypothetical protein
MDINEPPHRVDRRLAVGFTRRQHVFTELHPGESAWLLLLDFFRHRATPA